MITSFFSMNKLKFQQTFFLSITHYLSKHSSKDLKSLNATPTTKKSVYYIQQSTF